MSDNPERMKYIGLSYCLVDSSTVESLHCAFCCAWIVVFNETVIEPLTLRSSD